MAASAAYRDWNAGQAEWNTCFLGEFQLPGLVTIEGPLTCGNKIDIQHKKGKDGTSVVDTGTEPSKFKIKCQITTAEWPAWLRVFPNIRPRQPGVKRGPFQVQHPLPNHAGVSAVLVEKVELPHPTAQAGFQPVIHIVEWQPAPKDTSTTKTVKPLHAAADLITGALDQFRLTLGGRTQDLQQIVFQTRSLH